MKKAAKKAFTITELLIVITFIGFIIIQQILTANKKMNEYNANYYNAFNTLRKVSYNIFIDTYCPDSNNEPDIKEGEEGYNADYDCTKYVRAFPYDSTELCKRYGEYFNIPDNINCAAENVNKNATNINDDSLKFTTSNSYRFYISDNEGKPYEYLANRRDSDEKEKIEYFIVYVDINGKQMPNTVTVNNFRNKVLPDIVPFAVTRKGEVVPMGYPIFSMDYLVARVRFPSDPDDLDQNGMPKEKLSDFMSFNNAVRIAWQEGEDDVDMPYSWHLTDEMPDENLAKKFFIGDEPKVKPPMPIDISAVEGSEDCQAQTYNCSVIISKSEHVR